MASEITPGQKVLLNFCTVVEGPKGSDDWTEVELPWEVGDDGPLRLWCQSDDTVPLDDLREVLEDLIDSGECRFDHHGYCQEHTWLTDERPCPHPRARALLAQLGGQG